MPLRRPIPPLHHLLALVAGCILALLSGVVAAQSQRTFVASFGDDASANCSLASPCRSFNAAIAKTNPNGEVIILDTAGYGPMTITKSLKVIGPAGVYGGISVITAGSTGVTINAGDNDIVILRGLDVSGLGGRYGIDIQNAGAVHIEKSSVSNFGNFAVDNCIRMTTAREIKLYIVDSLIRECRTGLNVQSTATTAAARPFITIDNTRFERGLNLETGSHVAIGVGGGFGLHLRDSVITGYNGGVYANMTQPAAVSSRVWITESTISNAGYSGIQTFYSGGTGGMTVGLERSSISTTTYGVLLGYGSLRLNASQIAGVTQSIVDCGTTGTVESIGNNYIGSNTDDAVGLPGGCTAIIVPTIVPVR
jgi:hypothetical protein